MNHALVGPTGIGKTKTLMLLLDKPLLVRNLEDLKKLRDNKGKILYKNIIFDDISFRHVTKAETVIHMLDREYHCPIRVLRDVVEIPPSINRWFTHNNEDFLEPVVASQEQLLAINRRVQIHKVWDRREVQELVETKIRTHGR